MPDNITVVGVVGSDMRHVMSPDKLPVTTFRLASTNRRFDRAEQRWVDGHTNWFSVACFRQLAVNVVASVEKGQRVVVTGRLQLKDWNNGEKSGTDVEIVADAIGHDLSWGTTSFARTVVASSASAPEPVDPGEAGSEGEPGTDGPGDTATAEAPLLEPSAVPVPF